MSEESITFNDGRFGFTVWNPGTMFPDQAAIESALRRCDSPEKLAACEREMMKIPQVDLPVKHYFCHGVYVRELLLPRGLFATGHAHREDCLNIVLTGSASLLMDGEVRLFRAPMIFTGKALHRKVGFIHENCRWLTLHATTETNLDRLEELLLVKSSEIAAFEKRQQTVGRRIFEYLPATIEEDRRDFSRAIAELGFSPEEVEQMSRDASDLIPMPEIWSGRVEVRPSPIHGAGLFSLRKFLPEETLVLARDGYNRTPAGRFTNHSPYPNAVMVPCSDGSIAMLAQRTILPGDEITIDYRQSFHCARAADQLLTNEKGNSLCHPQL